MAKVIVACETGISTTKFISDKLEHVFKQENVHIQIVHCMVSEVHNLVRSGDVVVSTQQLMSDGSYTVFNGMPFLNGAGERELARRVVQAVRKSLKG